MEKDLEMNGSAHNGRGHSQPPATSRPKNTVGSICFIISFFLIGPGLDWFSSLLTPSTIADSMHQFLWWIAENMVKFVLYGNALNTSAIRAKVHSYETLSSWWVRRMYLREEYSETDSTFWYFPLSLAKSRSHMIGLYDICRWIWICSEADFVAISENFHRMKKNISCCIHPSWNSIFPLAVKWNESKIFKA